MGTLALPAVQDLEIQGSLGFRDLGFRVKP